MCYKYVIYYAYKKKISFGKKTIQQLRRTEYCGSLVQVILYLSQYFKSSLCMTSPAYSDH